MSFTTAEEEKTIVSCIRTAVSKSETNVFSALDEIFNSYFNRSCNNMLELRKRNEKNKGLIWEVFCKLYLKFKGYDAWLLAECPDDILSQLGMNRHDVGIDIIAKVTKGKNKVDVWFAVQCKYRSPKIDCNGRKVHRVGWREISTFISICTRTGKLYEFNDKKRTEVRAWTSHIIMTNADSVSWKGKKTKKDRTIAKKSFEKLTNIDWLNFLNRNSNSPVTNNKTNENNSSSTCQQTAEDVKALRTAWLSKFK